MSTHSKSVLAAAIVFAVAMGALESGGWWWAWLAASAVVLLRKGVRVPLIGVRLNPTSAYILRENRRTRRHNHELARHRRREQQRQRRIQRQQRRARRRQAQ